MTIKSKTDKDIEFDQSLLKKIRPGLAASEGCELTPGELSSIFGINATHFARLPERLVVPVLEGQHYTQHWYRTSGWLYVLEPLEWVPVVSRGETIAASVFKTSYSKKVKRLSETKFTAGCQAKVTLGAGGSYYGVSASVELSSEVSFESSSTSTTEEELETKGVVGNQPVHLLHVYPVLRCKAILRQRINYTINDSSEELKWDENSYNNGYWDKIHINSSRLQSVKKLQLHPVPMQGNGLGHKAYMLPVPEIKKSGRFEVTTLLKRTGWIDWYIYDEPFKKCSMNVDLAVPDNDGAFRPTSSWTTLGVKNGKVRPDEPSDSTDEGKGTKKGRRSSDDDSNLSSEDSDADWDDSETSNKGPGKKGGKGKFDESDSSSEATSDSEDTDKPRKLKKKGKQKGRGKSKKSGAGDSSSDESSLESSESESKGKRGKGAKKAKKREKKRRNEFEEGKVICALTPPDISD